MGLNKQVEKFNHSNFMCCVTYNMPLMRMNQLSHAIKFAKYLLHVYGLSYTVAATEKNSKLSKPHILRKLIFGLQRLEANKRVYISKTRMEGNLR